MCEREYNIIFMIILHISFTFEPESVTFEITAITLPYIYIFFKCTGNPCATNESNIYLSALFFVSSYSWILVQDLPAFQP